MIKLVLVAIDRFLIWIAYIVENNSRVDKKVMTIHLSIKLLNYFFFVKK